jgi:hypothetical protein
MVGRNAVMRRKRKLEGSAHARTVNRDDERGSHLVDGIEKELALVAQPLRFVGRLELEELLDVCAGDEAVLLATDENRGAHVEIALEPIEQGNELILYRAVELVDGLAWKIERDDGDSADDLSGQRIWRAHWSRSTTIEKPSPPAAQTVIRPNCPPRLRSSFRSVTVMRDPVAPKG